MFPNLYVLLVADPGIGKTTAIRFAREIMVRLPNMRLTPPMIIKEKFIDKLSTMHSTSVTNGSPKGVIPYIHSSVSAMLDEFSNFVKPRDFEFMSLLTEMFDCGETFEYSTMSRGDTRIENVCFSMIGATTPKTIGTIFGDASFGMGFTSRLLMVHSNELIPTKLFSVTKVPNYDDLIDDLKHIHSFNGEFTFTPESQAYIEEYYSQGMPPIPADSRFAEYLPRRIMHWLKLAMIHCASRTSDKIITLADLKKSQTVLLEAEADMPKALEFVGANPLADAIKQVHRWAAVKYSVTKQAIPEAAIRRILMKEVPVQYHLTVIEALIAGGYLEIYGANTAPDRLFIPRVITQNEADK